MDEKQMEQQLKKAKRFNYIVFTLAAALLIALTVGIIAELNKPYDPSIKTDGLTTALQGKQILTKAGASFYKLDGSAALTDLFRFSEWKKCDRFNPADEAATFHLAGQYSLTLYTDGHAAASNGYAAKGKRGNIWYEVPGDVAKAVKAYVEAHGTKIDFEEGVTESLTLEAPTDYGD